MTKLLFVHGMNGTAKNWADIPSRLSSNTDLSFAVQLPGHHKEMSFASLGGDSTYKSDVFMDDYIAEVAKHFPAGSERDVVLIGHSMGGAVISHVAAKHSDRVAKLIYMAAMLPDNKQSAGAILAWIKGSGEIDLESFLGDFRPHLGKLEAVFQPKEPLTAGFSRTSDFDLIQKAYIRCTEDHVIPVPLQDQMLNAYSGTEIVTLDRSHFPQFQNAAELASTIQGLLPK